MNLPLTRKANCEGYLRNISVKKLGQEELGLRNVTGSGAGTTTMKSISNGDLGGGQERGGLRIAKHKIRQGLNWLDSEGLSRNDSSDEFLPSQNPGSN